MSDLFGRHAMRAVYEHLMSRVRTIGPMTVRETIDTVELVTAGRTFAVVRPKTARLDLEIVSTRPLASPTVVKTNKTSEQGVHNLVRVARTNDVDHALMALLRDAYAGRR